MKKQILAFRWTHWFRPRNSLVLAGLLRFLHPVRLAADDGADYRFEDFNEDHGRVHVRTHSVLLEKSLLPWLTLKGEAVYDGISGATPTGAPPPTGSTQVPTTELVDIRRAWHIEPNVHIGQHTVTPQLSYSKESDYRSVGLSLNYSLDLNQKNTRLTAGFSHDTDKIQPRYWLSPEKKYSSDLLVGITQLMGPSTILTANFTFGTVAGYMADPYKIVLFDNPLDGFDQPLGYALTTSEVRPRHKTKQVLYLSLNQFVKPANASIEASYRFYPDSFYIYCYTAGPS